VQISLLDLPAGVNGRVSLITAKASIPRLEVIGIRNGVTVTPLFKSANKTLVVRVGDARVCISSAIAKFIEVETKDIGKS
jgi:Fe2+ transport system protein FeoA